MLSLIICARANDIPLSLKENIADTIGADYEIVVIDNSDNSHSIFSAYNLGAQKSKYPYLCFMHDDIAFHTQNWGELVSNHFNDEKAGAIGIAGTPYVPYMPGSWWGGNLVNINILSDREGGEHHSFQAIPPTTANKNNVLVLDGVWFCIRKSLFDKIRFDDVTYSGFHFYDVDITMQVSQAGYNVYCVFDILIKHCSEADINETWIQNALAFNKKWNTVLPAACTQLEYVTRCEAELKTLNEFARMLMANGRPQKKAYRTVLFMLLKHFRIYFYYKTPAYLGKYLMKSLN
ncbi:MAG: glycosyltransferase [Mucilaginibacter sp.]